MTKTELTATVAQLAKTGKADARIVIDALLLTLKRELAAHGKVVLHGFGSFEVRETAARAGRNPQTGEPLEIPAGLRGRFSASQQLRDLIKAQAD